jgi:hypothetical protein
MKRLMIGLAAVTAMGLMSSGASAQDRDFTLHNQTGYAMKGIYVNLPNDNVYNENELSAPLANGAKFLVKFTRADGGRACVWNIKVDWADGSSPSFFRGLNLCEINNVYMKYNKDTDVTSYTTD